MAEISLCMIVKNEEAVLGRCLDSALGLADETIIVDTGSEDNTKAVAERYTDKIFDYAWEDDFAGARNFAFAKATKPYIMWLDADDVIPAGEREGFLAMKQTLDGSADAVMMPYHTAFDETGRVLFTVRRERVLRREAGFLWKGSVHEYIPLRGNIASSEAAVHHLRQKPPGDRNLRIYEAMRSKGKPFDPRDTYYYARELFDHNRWEESAQWLERFLVMEQGWSEDKITACLMQGRCYQRLGRREKRLAALTRSFGYDLPRPEICCELGYFHKERGRLDIAAYWFTRALTAPKGGGFSQVDMGAYVPHLELCVCHEALGDLRRAWMHNEAALLCKPGSKEAAANRAYLASRLPK